MIKIAIFGLGVETGKKIIELKQQYEVVGLLDSFVTSGERYGIPIISLNEVAGRGASRIVIIARSSSCRVITSNIGEFCRKKKIELCDMYGHDLLMAEQVSFEFNLANMYTKLDLLRAIDESEVISFDLFDTLIMRVIPTYYDFIELLDTNVKRKSIDISTNYGSKRYMAEIQLSRHCCPKLLQIYKFANPQISETAIEEYAEYEYELDESLIVPRYDVIEVMRYARQQGKKVYITSDTYYLRDQLIDLLKKKGIVDFDEVLPSCEYGTGKNGNLFEILKSLSGTEKILHIGDDINADIESAIDHGISAFHLYSGYELYSYLGELGLSKHVKCITDKCKIGQLIAMLFNSPFQFERSGEQLTISNIDTIAKSFFAPIIMDYVYWLGNCVSQRDTGDILFSARDGYLLKDIYELIYGRNCSKYLLTSRIAAIRAGIEDEEDIISTDSTVFSGSLKEKLFVRFGIINSELDTLMTSNVEPEILKYKERILSKVHENRQYYRKYLEKMCITDAFCSFVDLAAKGTVQRYMERVIGHPLKGYYLFQLEPEYAFESGIDVSPFFNESEKLNSHIVEDFYILEPVLSSPMSTVIGFDKEGEPIYENECRDKTEIDNMCKMQESIKKYVKDILKIIPKEEYHINKELDDALFDLIHKIKIDNQEFMSMQNIDSFVNRKTTMNTGI